MNNHVLNLLQQIVHKNENDVNRYGVKSFLEDTIADAEIELKKVQNEHEIQQMYQKYVDVITSTKSLMIKARNQKVYENQEALKWVMENRHLLPEAIWSNLQQRFDTAIQNDNDFINSELPIDKFETWKTKNESDALRRLTQLRRDLQNIIDIEEAITTPLFQETYTKYNVK